MQAAQPMLQAQARLSHLPRGPPAGGAVALARRATTSSSTPSPAATCTWGWRSCWPGGWRATQPNTFSLSVNDYGLEILAAKPVDVDGCAGRQACSAPEDLLADVLASLNSGELAQRRFREIARVAGLVFSGYPGAPKSLRQLQASSSLFYEVFRKYDAGNRLLGQAQAEVLRRSWKSTRLAHTLQRWPAGPTW
jgi:ATP-dependent Lhr-like helicase